MDRFSRDFPDCSINPPMDRFSSDFPDAWSPVFQKYLMAENYSYSVQEKSRIFVCGPNPIHQFQIPNPEIADKISSLLTRLQHSSPITWLGQFWTADIREERCLLTTRNQPFIINFNPLFEHELCMYRMACKDYEFNVGSDVEEGRLGILGRVFRHRTIETTPNVKYYTDEQYPLRDVALSFQIKSLMAVPVFEPSSLCCVGVLEFVSLYKDPGFTRIANDICKVLREVGLEPPIVHANHCERHKDEKIKKAMAPALREIKKTLTESCKIGGVHLCQAWAPCTSCNDVFNGDSMMGVLFQKCKRQLTSGVQCLSEVSFIHHLRKGQGIAGRAFSSSMLSLCMDTTKLNIIDYPLAHFARDSELHGCFSICLQSNHTRNNVCVLEFFLKYSGDPFTLLYMILEVMKKCLLSFKVASGQKLGEKLPIIVIDSQMNTILDSIQIPEKRELVQHPIMAAMTTTGNDVIREQSSIHHSIQRIEERASMQQPSMATGENNVIQDPNTPDFVPISKERASVRQPSKDAMMLGRNGVIKEPNNILGTCSKQERAIDAIKIEHKESEIPIDMSNMNEKLDCIETADGQMVQQCPFGQPSENSMNTGTDDTSANPNEILNSNSQRIRTTETGGKQCRKSGIPITLENIQQQFGKKLQDAAGSLGVSRSTLKRACREYEILWWRPGKRNNGNHAASNASTEVVSQDLVLPRSSNMPYQPSLATGTSEIQNDIPLESTNNMDIKVIYGDKFGIKFQLPLSSGIVGLKQQVVKRLNGIDFEKYSFQYQDEEDDWISILCDEDLHHYLSNSTSSTKTLVTIYLKPFSFCLA